MSGASSAPNRACILNIEIQADTRADMVHALETIAIAIDRGEMTRGCSGGPSSGWTYEYTEAERPTHDEYVAELRAYLADARAAE